MEGSLKNEDKDKSDQNEANSVASGSSNSSTSTGNSMANTNNNSKAKDDPLLTSYSKYDFIPESEFLFFDDFSQDAVADFPALWNTDASGEIVTTNNFTGKWLKLTAVGNFIPEYYKTFPDNFTLEFDVIPDEQAVLGFDIYKAENPKDINEGVAIPRRRHKNMV